MNSILARADTTHMSDFIPSLKSDDMRMWMWRGAAAAEKLQWGLRASCSGYRLTEASDPATTSLSKVTQAKSEHKRLFLPAFFRDCIHKKLCWFTQSKDGWQLQTSQTKTIKTLQKSPHKQSLSLKCFVDKWGPKERALWLIQQKEFM